MNAASLYKQNSVLTANKGKLVVMLYEGAMKFLKLAVRSIDLKNYEAKSKNITRAKNIIVELNTTLNMEEGGQISQNLRALYNFMLSQLSLANLKLDCQLINNVITLLDELNQGWRTVSD